MPLHRKSLPVSRRTALVATAAWLAAPGVHAQPAWPAAGPIKLIVPFAPGGSTDGVARQIADELRSRLGQTVLVDNRAGAGSTLGTGLVAKATPDGYTLLVSVISASSVGSTLYRGRLDWDPDKSFAHIADILRTPYALMANKNAPYANLAEFVAAAKRSPGISFGTSGVGSIPHLVMMRFARAAGIELTHIPYRGGALAVTDAIGGTLTLVMDGLAAAVPHLRSGALKGLGVTSATRSSVLPELATFVEQGFRDTVVEGWAGIAAPAGTPRPILEKLASAIKEVMALPAMQERYKAASSTSGSLLLDDMQKFVRADAEAWRPLVIDSGATVD
jgi:tripartite-type tricarboxylate transporter receptor subunit TctC